MMKVGKEYELQTVDLRYELFPMHSSAACGYVDSIRTEFCKRPFAVNSRQLFTHITPLMAAIQGNRYCSIQELISLGADVNLKDINGASALHYAASQGVWATVMCLLKSKAYTCTVDVRKRTPLHAACMSRPCDADVVNTLVARGVELDARDVDGRTALHYACWNGNVEAAKCLVKLGANDRAKDYGHAGVLSFSSMSPCLELTRHFLKEGHPVNQKSAFGTPLQASLQAGEVEQAFELLEREENPLKEGSQAMRYCRDEKVRRQLTARLRTIEKRNLAVMLSGINRICSDTCRLIGSFLLNTAI